ncbi:MAG: hypothetical protein JRF42_13020 [Deltaproteobacteria bacterium]|nr:hypothetical protein [Deltaproteobacteria bacterium]
MLRKFVLITGFLDIPIGLATWAAAILEPQDTHFGALMTCGAFLIFAGAFWQALVRVTAVAAIMYMVPKGIADSWQYGICVFDGGIALVYITGMMKHTGTSFFGLMVGKTG